jgi:hypothetical protein
MLLHKLYVSMMMALTYIVLGCDQIKKEKLFNFGIHMAFIPPANIVWGVYRNRPVCLSICPDQLPHLLSDFHQTLWNLRS